jgi:exodeoxyribonuclease VII large subunit
LASVTFAAPANALNPRLLMRLVEAKAQRLSAARIPASALAVRLANSQSRLDAIARLAESLHPEAPLKRGFARVTDKTGKTIMNVAAARKAGHVGLRFADGDLGATVDGATVDPEIKAAQIKAADTPGKSPEAAGSPVVNVKQGNLFSE